MHLVKFFALILCYQQRVDQLPEGAGVAGNVCLFSSGIVKHNLGFGLSGKAYFSVGSVISVRFKCAGCWGGPGAIAVGAAGAAAAAAAAAAGGGATPPPAISRSIKSAQDIVKDESDNLGEGILVDVYWSRDERRIMPSARLPPH